jgi:predicted XRE-type DNA-binding protein
MKKKLDYTLSSGNVFADIGLPNPEEALVKAELADRISTVIRNRGLTQTQAARMLGIDQPKISALIRGRLTPFSIERMLRFLPETKHDMAQGYQPLLRSAVLTLPNRVRIGLRSKYLRVPTSPG